MVSFQSYVHESPMGMLSPSTPAPAGEARVMPTKEVKSYQNWVKNWQLPKNCLGTEKNLFVQLWLELPLSCMRCSSAKILMLSGKIFVGLTKVGQPGNVSMTVLGRMWLDPRGIFLTVIQLTRTKSKVNKTNLSHNKAFWLFFFFTYYCFIFCY